MTRTSQTTALRAAVSAAEKPPVDPARAAFSRLTDLSREFAPDLSFSVYTDFAPVADEWRRFETVADCTPFQTFEWLVTWHRHVGRRNGVVPVIVVGRFADGGTAVIMPLAIQGRPAGRLSWLGQELCDYNAPLLARDFSQRVAPARFAALWQAVQRRLQSDSSLRYDWIEFEKMPQTIGVQPNPFAGLRVIPNANSAHLTQLGGDWEKFYFARRSSSTRRRDRAKRKRMAEHGDVRFVSVSDADEMRQTLQTLWDQKKKIFARKGIADIFARPGYREFFADFATNANSHRLAHVSRVDVGSACAAANFGMVLGDCYYHVLSSYCDGQLTRFGPGVLHLRELMAYAVGRGLRRFDFTIGDEQYKLEWSDLRLRLYDYSDAATWRGWPKSTLFTARRRAKRFIKQTPLVWRLVCRLRAALGPFLNADAAKPQIEPLDDAQQPVTAASPAVPACVMGDMDLLRPLTMAGIPCAVAARPGVPSLYSRFTQARLYWDGAAAPPQQLDALVNFGKSLGDRPVLFYEGDEDALFLSRYRERLSQAFRFVIADADLVENLVDKGRFATLAQRLNLPVPPAVTFNPVASEPSDLGLHCPVVIKPLTRLAQWHAAFGWRKVLSAENPDVLRQLWPELQALGSELLAQQLVAGDETRMETYHCYIDARGAVVGEFTGRKIRTRPLAYGHTTALETTDAEDVRLIGRDVAELIGLTGVAKFDFKRDAAGNLHLFEINPRFTLWLHAGAAAGVNIPALVHADLTGTLRPPAGTAKAGIRWSRAWRDMPAALAARVPPATWLAWFAACETKSALTVDDPMPLLGAALHLAAARWRGQRKFVS